MAIFSDYYNEKCAADIAKKMVNIIIVIRLFIYINVAVKRVLGDPEIICHLISGFCDQKSARVIEKLDSGNFILFVHKGNRFADEGYRFFNQTIQKVIDTVGNLFWFFLFILWCDQIIQCAVDQSQLGNVIVDPKYIVKTSIVILYI